MYICLNVYQSGNGWRLEWRLGLKGQEIRGLQPQRYTFIIRHIEKTMAIFFIFYGNTEIIGRYTKRTLNHSAYWNKELEKRPLQQNTLYIYHILYILWRTGQLY